MCADYIYYCPRCEERYEVNKSMSRAEQEEYCPHCGFKAERRYTGIPFSFGWRLSDESNYVKGTKDTFVRDI